MADQERRTTTKPTPASQGARNSTEATRRRWAPSSIWLILAAVLAILLGLYIYNSRLNLTRGDEAGGEVILEGEAVEVAPEAEAPGN